jgi:DNA-binding CsgD family transcriptional regulator
MNTAIPRHGTNARYKGRQNLPGCRCRPCTTAASREDAQRRLDRLSGRARTASPELFQKVLNHLRYLVAGEMSHAQIGAGADVAQSTVSQLLSGQRKSLHSSTARKLLKVRIVDLTDTCMVSAVGAMRRCQALYWMGHRSQDLAIETGLHEDTILGLARGRWDRTTAARRNAVYEAYDRLAMVRGMSERARQFAVGNGWHGPLAWDDDTIDDPRAVPQTDALGPAASDGENVAARWLMGESVILSRAERNEVLQYLFEWTTDTTAQIAARLEMSPEAAERQWHRLQQKAAADGRRLWRRAWAYRDKDLTKNEMGEAA